MSRTSTKVSPLEAHLGFWLRFLSNHVSARFEKSLQIFDITVPEWVALRTLYERPGVTHAELIEALGMTKGAVSKVITRLESKGLAQRRLAEDKAREQILLLTARGRRLVPKLAACADENDQFFFGDIRKSQRAELLALIRELVRRHELKAVPIE